MKDGRGYPRMKREYAMYNKNGNSFFHPFLANFFIINPLKAEKNFWYYGVFKGYKMGQWPEMN